MQETLTRTLQTVPGLESAGVAWTAAGGIAAFESRRPDVVILDLVLQAGSGFEVLLRIKEHTPACQVLVFTGHDEDSFRKRCLAAGADYFLSKNRDHGELLHVLRNIRAHAAPPPAPSANDAIPCPPPGP